MALIVGKRNVNSDKPEPMISSPKKWCTLPDSIEKHSEQSVIMIPETPLQKLKNAFPTTDDKVLEEALRCSNYSIQAASQILMQQYKPMPIQDQQMEDRKMEVQVPQPKPKRSNLIQLYLTKMEKVQNRDEAYKLTELLLKRYKTNVVLNVDKMEDTTSDLDKQNKVLKKGMRILTGRYAQLQQCVQKEQEKNAETEQKMKELTNELNYYRSIVGSLSNRLRDLDSDKTNYVERPRFDQNPDVF